MTNAQNDKIQYDRTVRDLLSARAAIDAELGAMPVEGSTAVRRSTLIARKGRVGPLIEWVRQMADRVYNPDGFPHEMRALLADPLHA